MRNSKSTGHLDAFNRTFTLYKQACERSFNQELSTEEFLLPP
jgi:hypothetical protein